MPGGDVGFIRYHSREGAYNTVTFTSVDDMPAVLRGISNVGSSKGGVERGQGQGRGTLDPKKKVCSKGVYGVYQGVCGVYGVYRVYIMYGV